MINVRTTRLRDYYKTAAAAGIDLDADGLAEVWIVFPGTASDAFYTIKCWGPGQKEAMVRQLRHIADVLEAPE